MEFGEEVGVMESCSQREIKSRAWKGYFYGPLLVLPKANNQLTQHSSPTTFLCKMILSILEMVIFTSPGSLVFRFLRVPCCSVLYTKRGRRSSFHGILLQHNAAVCSTKELITECRAAAFPSCIQY